jgi:hypothetical protein
VLLGRAGVDRRLIAGTVSAGAGAPVWRPRRGRAVSLSGCELLRVAAATGHDPAARAGDVVLTVRDAGGHLLRLCMSGADAPLVQDWIAAARSRTETTLPPTGVAPDRRWWRVATLRRAAAVPAPRGDADRVVSAS